MEQEGSRKRRGTECDCDAFQKKSRTPATNEADEKDGQDMIEWLTLHDETVTELSELLDSSEICAQQFNFKVKFIEDPYMTPVIFQSSSAYVTINGNEESCGSSFSDSESTVMASVDMGSFRVALRKLSRELSVDDGGADAAAEDEGARGWMEGESDYMEGILVKSLSGCCDLFATSICSPPSGCYYENDSGYAYGDCGGDDEMWVNFLGEDLFGGAW